MSCCSGPARNESKVTSMNTTAARLALDHLTVVDTTPSQLVEAAAAADCRAICTFLEPMSVLPDMPLFEMNTGSTEFHKTKALMADLGIGLDIAYPFTLAGRTDVSAFRPALECAAGLDAWGVNILNYDREPARQAEKFAVFCELAAEFDLNVVVEFFPQSQVKTLEQALDLVTQINKPGRVGVNVDLLHLVRSGGSIAALAAAPAEFILYGQYCDAPDTCEPDKRDFEASAQRMIPGEGALDVAAFSRALPPACLTSVELPQHDALVSGMPIIDRARRAVTGVSRLLADL